jgi:sec-independent protein translocase protein TatA
VLNTIGISGLLILLGIAILILGPKRLPGLGRSLGAGLREFKDSVTGKASSDEDRAGHVESSAAPVEGEGGHRALPERASVADGEAAGRRRS